MSSATTGRRSVYTSHDLADVERSADRIAACWPAGGWWPWGRRAELTGAGAPRLRFRLAAPLDAADMAGLAAAVASGAGDRVVTAGAGAHYEIEGLAEAADPRLVAALAAWCAEHGLLITELRLGSASWKALPGAGRHGRDRRGRG